MRWNTLMYKAVADRSGQVYRPTTRNNCGKGHGKQERVGTGEGAGKAG